MNIYQSNETVNVILIILTTLYVVLNKNYIFSERVAKSNNGYLLFGIFITIFSLYYRVGYDFNGHQELLLSYQYGNYYTLHMEDFFYWIWDNVTNDYLAWRAVVWGLSAICVVLCFKALKANCKFASLVFITFALFECFYYLRNSLAFGTLYLGIILFTSTFPQKKLSPKILLSILLLMATAVLHKSAVMYIAFALLAIIIPINKITVISAILLFPLIKVSIGDLIINILNNIGVDESTVAYGEMYLETKSALSLNFLGYIGLIINSFPFLLIIAHPIYNKLFKNKKIDFTQKTLLLTSAIIFYAYYLVSGVREDVQSRIWDSAMYPLALFASVYLFDKRKTRFYRIVVYSLVLMFLYNFFVSII